MNPKATIVMENGAKIVIELLPESAPNTVNSFISLASKGVMDHHAIQRIVPGKWVDVTYTAFGKPEAKYCIPWEYELHPELKENALYSAPGYVCMGGYDAGEAGGEFFFPVNEFPKHQGVFPVFGKVVEGMDEIYRIIGVETFPVEGPVPEVEINEPVVPEVIDHVELELYGETYPEPIKLPPDQIPFTWKECWGEKK